jgi:hypothetical protein
MLCRGAEHTGGLQRFRGVSSNLSCEVLQGKFRKVPYRVDTAPKFSAGWKMGWTDSE